MHNQASNNSIKKDRKIIHNQPEDFSKQSRQNIQNVYVINGERYWPSIYDRIEAAIFVIEVLNKEKFRYIALNKACERWIGISIENLKGKTPEEIFSAEDAKKVNQNYRNCVDAEKTISYELSVLLKGTPSWWITTLTPVKDDSDRVYQLIGTSININKHKQAEQELRQGEKRDKLLADIALRIRQSLDLETILNRTVCEVRKFLSCDRVLVFQFHPNWSGFVAVESVVPPWKKVVGRRLKDDCFTKNYQKQYQQGRIQVVENIYEAGLSSCHVDLLASFEVKANLVVPILVEEKLWGLLVAQHCRSPRKWQPENVELLKQLAIQVGIAVQQAELHQQVQDFNADLEWQVEKRTYQLQQTLNFEALIRRITEEIRDSLDESQILQAATQNLVEALKLDTCKVELYNSDYTMATIAYEYATGFPVSQGMTRKVAEFQYVYDRLLEKQTLQFVELNPSLNPKRKIPVTRLACSIFDDQGILGNLWLIRPKKEFFDPWEIRLVQQVANQCAIAIRQARLFQKAQVQVKELEKLNRIKDEFLKTISHELRTPMSSIQLAAKTLENLLEQEDIGKKSSTFTRVLNLFRQACQRQTQIVDDLLTICYIDAKGETIATEWIDLSIWIPEIVKPFLERINSQQQELKIDLPPNLPLLDSDVAILKRIVNELLNNACKYTPSKEKITVSASATDKHLRLSVSNSGVEIPVSERERIFEKFYRIPHKDPWQYGGTGLGLALVEKLAELLEASIYLESKNNQTTFTLQFPI
ncbi:MAG: GAF domain-containing protein [Prochloraceae cyanobacterium]|nr:GAF domain-containing protein [Prochloraceae cyanobacterium]